MNSSFQKVQDYLPESVRRCLRNLPESVTDEIQEIRLRCGRPVMVSQRGKELFLTPSGLSDKYQNVIFMTCEDIARTFQAVMSHSVYSHEQDIAEGFVTIRGGCRVGICGSAVRKGNSVQSLRNVSGLNFRIAKEFQGIASGIWRQAENTSILIAGTVGSGKTTFLRDLCRIVGDSQKTSLIDERGEIASVVRGIPQYQVGVMTDILDGYPRKDGILTALRVLTPSYIVCDEISTEEDVNAILQAHGCGVKFIASVHAGNFDDIRKRSIIQPLFQAGVFQYCVYLNREQAIQRVQRL